MLVSLMPKFRTLAIISCVLVPAAAVLVGALAILVNGGKIGWDDKVIYHLSWFRLYDPWVTREMTIRDLLVRRSGLGLAAGDLLFVPDAKAPRGESVRRLRYIKPATSFRSGYAYDNVLYIVAGQLIEAVTGETWKKRVAEHGLKPAGMLHSTSDGDVRFARPDRAQPHAWVNGAFRGIGDQQMLDERQGLGRNAAPAGGLTVSANDMLEHWQYETFKTRFDDTTIEPAYVTFALDAEGKVERITMKAVSPAADFSYDYHDLLFTPVVAKEARP